MRKWKLVLDGFCTFGDYDLKSFLIFARSRIIIYVPRRINTVHHHHHHVVLMDQKKKTMHHTVPSSPYAAESASSEDDGYQVREHGESYPQQNQNQLQQQPQKLRSQHPQPQPQRHQRQRLQQSSAVNGGGDRPASYVEQRKTIGMYDREQNSPKTNALTYHISPRLPVAHVPSSYATWPVRKKRSKFVRLYCWRVRFQLIYRFVLKKQSSRSDVSVINCCGVYFIVIIFTLVSVYTLRADWLIARQSDFRSNILTMYEIRQIHNIRRQRYQ